MTTFIGIDRTTRALAVALTAAVLLGGCGRRPAEESPAAAARTESPAVPRPADATPRPADASPPATSLDPATVTPAAYESRGGIEPGRAMTLRDAYPDYRPGANDPEIESTRTGRRQVAVHDRAFETGGAATLADLVAAIVSGVDRADGEALDRTAVTFRDFDTILWPEMPQSRPAAGVPVGEAWDFLRRRHLSAFNRTAGDQSGAGLVVQHIEVGKVVEYTNFRLHDDIRVTVTDAAGEVRVFPMIRTVAECRGRYKLYSTRD